MPKRIVVMCSMYFLEECWDIQWSWICQPNIRKHITWLECGWDTHTHAQTTHKLLHQYSYFSFFVRGLQSYFHSIYTHSDEQNSTKICLQVKKTLRLFCSLEYALTDPPTSSYFLTAVQEPYLHWVRNCAELSGRGVLCAGEARGHDGISQSFNDKHCNKLPCDELISKYARILSCLKGRG